MRVAICLSLLLFGCQSKAGTGALAGGAIGVGAGALIGGGSGALIGGAVGSVAGAGIGAILDAEDRDKVRNNNPRTLDKIDNNQQLSVSDVISLHQSGVSDDKIIELIRQSDTHFNLNEYKLSRLRRAGVSERIIQYMLNT